MALYASIQDLTEPLYSKERRHVSWGKLTVAIERFQLMMETQQKQLLDSLYEIITKKLDYLKSFIDFKQSLSRIRNKEEVLTMNPKRVGKFLQAGYEEVVTIFKYLKLNPRVLSNLLTHLPAASQKFFPDLALNLVGLYNSPCFLHQQTHKNSQLSLFFDAILENWSYTQNIETTSIHSQIILTIFKLPESKRFIENLFKRFNRSVLQEIIEPEKSIDFNKRKIKQEIDERNKQKQTANKNQAKPSFFKRVKKLFGKKQEAGKQEEAIPSAEEEKQIMEIQLQRIERLDIYLRKTIHIILTQEIPSICKFLASKLVQKLNRKDEIPFAEIGNLFIKHWIGTQIKDKIKQMYGEKKYPQISIMISFVENIFLDRFQKVVIDEKFSFNSLREEKLSEIQRYYKSIVHDLSSIPPIETLENLAQFERSLAFVSFRDVVLLVNLIKAAQTKKDLPEPLLSLNLKFSEDTIYEPNNKISFDKKPYYNYNIYFCIPLQSEEEYVSKSYLGSKTPLSDIPSITQALLKSNLPVDDALKISSSLEFLKGVEGKVIIKAFEGFQNSHLHLPAGISQLQSILTLTKKSDDVLQNKSKFLSFKQIIMNQFTHHITQTERYITKVKADYIYQKYIVDVIENMPIEIYISVDNQIRVQEHLPKQYKKLDIKLVLVGRKEESHEMNVMNEILENGMKKFQRIPRLLEAIAKLDYTKKAFLKWELAEEFNLFFKRLISILHKALDKNFKADQSMIDSETQKKMFNQAVSEIVVGKIKRYHHSKEKPEKARDFKFLGKIRTIDVQTFKEEELKDAPVEDFAIEQAIKKFRGIDDKQSPQAKLAEFDMLIREVFKVISLSLPKQKITADVITPIVQYIILKAQAKYSVRNACEIRCLCIQQNNYLLTLWRSAIRYLQEYSKKNNSITMSGTSINSSGQDFPN